MDDGMVISRTRRSAGAAGASARGKARALRMPSARLGAGADAEPPTADPAREPARSGTIWFDYTDLVHYFEDNRVPTGIQRVQIGLFRATLAREAGAAPERLAACSFDTQRRCWVAIPDALLASVCRAACSGAAGVVASGVADEAWRALTGALRHSVSSGPSAPFAPGDMLVNIGSSWWIADYLRYVHHLQRERGVLYVAFVHDCIPLRVPETCAANLVDEFGAWFAETMRIADIVLANSEHTARDIRLLAPAVGGEAVQPHVVRLDARFDDGPQPGPAAIARLDATTHAGLGIRRPFALFVATLEARKNHIFVFRCWESLIEKHGNAVPDLICVGKQGWLFDYTQNWLRVHPKLAGRVRLVGTLSDHDVAALYRTAQFTVYCSHYEGWGLPVTESLCYGRVPVVPDNTALPEAGGRFAAYYEPESQDGFCAQVELLMDRSRRGELESRIRAGYQPRSWTDVLTQMTSALRQATLRSGAALAAADMRPGRIYGLARPRREAAMPAGMESGERLKHGIGWHAAEEWGTWSRLEQAQLLFTLTGRKRDCLMYLLVRGGPAEQGTAGARGGRGHRAGDAVCRPAAAAAREIWTRRPPAARCSSPSRPRHTAYPATPTGATRARSASGWNRLPLPTGATPHPASRCWSSSWPRRDVVRLLAQHQQDVQRARPVHAGHAAQLDIGGGGWAGGEGERPALVDAVAQARHRLGHQPHDLGRPHDAQPVIRQQRHRPPALARAAVEHDGSGLGDGQRAAGHGARQAVKHIMRLAAILGDVDAGGPPAGRQVGGDDETADPALAQPRRGGGGDRVRSRDIGDHHAVVAQPGDEPVQQDRARRVPGPAEAGSGIGQRRRAGGDRRADVGQHRLTAAHVAAPRARPTIRESSAPAAPESCAFRSIRRAGRAATG